MQPHWREISACKWKPWWCTTPRSIQGKPAARSAWSQQPLAVGGLGICPSGQGSKAAVQGLVILDGGRLLCGSSLCTSSSLADGPFPAQLLPSLVLSQVSAPYQSLKASPNCSSSFSLLSSTGTIPSYYLAFLALSGHLHLGRLNRHNTLAFTLLYWEAHREDTGKQEINLLL